LLVYVFGIVVDAAMYALIALFCTVVSIVSAPPTLERPVPKRFVNNEPLSTKFVVDAYVNDASVVEEFVNLFSPDQKFESERRVDDAVESVAVIVIGDEPITVKDVHEADPEHDADVVAIVERSPVEPTYVRPCVSDVSLRAELNVEEAVENTPLSRPSVVDVLLYPVLTVNGNVEKLASFVSFNNELGNQRFIIQQPSR
jgi:hypothetical protein